MTDSQRDAHAPENCTRTTAFALGVLGGLSALALCFVAYAIYKERG